VAWICRVLATQSSGMRMIRQSSALQCQSVPFSARTCATSPTTCVHRRVHGFTSYEALPQYRMWYLRFPTSLTGICSLERFACVSLPREQSFERPGYIYLSSEGREGRAEHLWRVRSHLVVRGFPGLGRAPQIHGPGRVRLRGELRVQQTL